MIKTGWVEDLVADCVYCKLSLGSCNIDLFINFDTLSDEQVNVLKVGMPIKYDLEKDKICFIFKNKDY